MMKKLLLILVGLGLAIGILGAAGFAYAQAGDPPDGETTDDGGRSGRFFGRGHWFGTGGDDGILKDYLLPAFAKIFGLDDTQIQAFQTNRETLDSIKDEYTVEEIQGKMQDVFSAALDSAVADGTITQEEADQMLERREQMGEHSFNGTLGKGGRMPKDGLPFDEMGGMRGRMTKGGAGFDGRNGMLSEYMESALADELDLTVEELQDMKEEGFNLADYADENGLTNEELQDLMKSICTTAINNALEDGVISQDQADLILERLENSGGRLPFSPGSRSHGW